MDINSICTKNNFHNYVTIKQSDKTSLIELLLRDADGALLSNLSSECTVTLLDTLTNEIRQSTTEQIINGVLSFRVVNELNAVDHTIEITTLNGTKFPSDGNFKLKVTETHDRSLINIIRTITEELALKVVTQQVLNKIEVIKSDFNAFIKKGSVSVNDIDKNLGLLDQTYFTDETKAIWTGGASVNMTPLNSSITMQKLAFSKIISRNIYDKDSSSVGSVVASDGTVNTTLTTYRTSDFIEVNEGDVLKYSHGVSRFAFYDSGKGYKSGEQLSTAITSQTIPAGVRYIKVTFYYANNSTFMVSKNVLPPSYEPFQMAIDGRYLIDVAGSQLGDKSIEPKKTTFFTLGKNLADPSKKISGMYVSDIDGTLKVNAEYTAFHMVPIKPNTSYAYNFDGRVAFYDATGKFLNGIFGGGTAINKTATTPANAAYGTFSTKLPDTFQLEEGTTVTDYEEFGLFIDKSVLPKNETNINNVVINLPEKMYATVNEEFNIYNSALLKENDKKYNINYDCSKGKQIEGRYTLSHDKAETLSLKVEVYNRDVLLASKSTQIIVSNPRSTQVSMLLLGDSTVRSNGYGYITQTLLDTMNDNVKLIGTHGNGLNKYEGRGGWKGSTYRSNSSYEGVVNPFYNPAKNDFDFSYYMNNQRYPGVDVVVIQLGINDVFSATDNNTAQTLINEAKTNIDAMITSIKAYNTNIKVALNITIPPNDSQNLFGAAYGTGQTQWRYKYNNHMLVTEMINYFKAKVDLINTHTSIDASINIEDGVHPKLNGYKQMASSVRAYLNFLQ